MTKTNSSSGAQMSFSAARAALLQVLRGPVGRNSGRTMPMMAIGRHVHADGQQARNDAGDEQLADILLGDDAVDREHG